MDAGKSGDADRSHDAASGSTKRGGLVPSQTGRRRTTRSRTTQRSSPESRALRLHLPRLRVRGQPCKHVIAVESPSSARRPDGDRGDRAGRGHLHPGLGGLQRCSVRGEGDGSCRCWPTCAPPPQPAAGPWASPHAHERHGLRLVSRVYAGLSARRFDTDVREAEAKGLTEADPHFNSVLRYLRSPR